MCTAAKDARRGPNDHELRSARIIHAFNARLVHSQPLRHLFDTEPELSLPAGCVRSSTGTISPTPLVRLAEAFLLGDLGAGRPVAIEEANKLQTALLEADRLA